MAVESAALDALGGYVVPLLLPVALPCVLLLLVRRLWYEYLVQGRDPGLDAPLPEGSMGWPLIGETISFGLQGSEFYDRKFRQYGRLFKTHLFGRPTVRVRGAENIRKILHGENDLVASYWPTTTRLLFGPDCLSQTQGRHHARLRRHVSAAFSHAALAGYVELVQPQILEALDDWCRAPAGVAAYPECRLLTFRVAGKVLCGFDCGREETARLVAHFENIVHCLFCLPFNFPGSGLNRGLKARDFVSKRIEENIRRKCGEDDTHDALRILMEQDTETGEAPSTEVIVATAIDLLVAGYASTASAACSIILQLHQNRPVLERVRRELAEHGLQEPGGPLSLQALNDLKYVTSVVQEILRVSPPIGAGFRKALRTFELDGKQIPAGWTVLYSIRDTVAMSEVFTDRDRFDPDRFAPERREDRRGDRYNYCIFGGGPRSCVGKSFAMLLMRLLVVELARGCDWELLRPDALRLTPLPTPHPVDGMPVRFRRLRPARPGGQQLTTDHNANSVVLKCEEAADEGAASTAPAAAAAAPAPNLAPAPAPAASAASAPVAYEGP